jgi:dCMP deaminase
MAKESELVEKSETVTVRKRVSWDEYFMSIALQAATRSTCDRKHVGAVIVRDKTILSTGYNGSIRGLPHCDDVGHMMDNGHCIATVHAEANAIIQAAKNGTAINGADIYVTASPCWNCFKLIVNSGIRRIVFFEFYRDERILSVAKQAGVELVQIHMDAGESSSS